MLGPGLLGLGFELTQFFRIARPNDAGKILAQPAISRKHVAPEILGARGSGGGDEGRQAGAGFEFEALRLSLNDVKAIANGKCHYLPRVIRVEGSVGFHAQGLQTSTEAVA